MMTDIDRFRQLYRHNVGTLKGVSLFNEAAVRLEGTIRQMGGIDRLLARRASALRRQLIDDMRSRTADLCRDYRSGCTAVRQWLIEAIAVAEHMAAEAAKDTGAFEQRVAQFQRLIEHYQREYIPHLRRKSFAYRWLHRRRIDAAAVEYRRHLEERQVARIQLTAHLRAVDVINGLREACQARLIDVQAAIVAITAERDGARLEAERLATLKPDYSCPIGLPLIEGSEDLKDYYARLLPEGGQEQAVADVHGRLSETVDLLQLVAEPAKLRDQIAQAVASTFRDKIAQMHVADEVLRRFPNRADRGALVKERIRESYERVPLRDSCDEEHGTFLVRLFGIDTARAGDLRDVVARFDDPRGTPFEIVDVPDRYRITFLQFRATIPLSGWAGFQTSREAYLRASQNLAFERFHVTVGDRFLPVPGEPLTPLAIAVIAIKAWILGRLAYDDVKNEWQLLTADESPCSLGKDFEAFDTSDGYRLAVDVISCFTASYAVLGHDAIIDRLGQLCSPADTVAPESVEQRLTGLVSEEAFKSFAQELAWWKTNTTPRAMATNGKVLPLAHSQRASARVMPGGRS